LISALENGAVHDREAYETRLRRSGVLLAAWEPLTWEPLDLGGERWLGGRWLGRGHGGAPP